MPDRKHRLIPSYNTILVLSVVAAILVTLAFIYFSITFFQAEKRMSTISPAQPQANALRVLILSTPRESGQNPIEAGLLSYLTQSLHRETVPILRASPEQAAAVLATQDFDIAIASERDSAQAQKKGYADVLVASKNEENQPEKVFVLVRKGTDNASTMQIKRAFLNMKDSSAGRRILLDLRLSDFIEPY